MKILKLTTVRQKIGLLLIIGVICGAAIASVNKVIDIRQTEQMKLSAGSYEIALKILDILRLEEEYISLHNDNTLVKISENRQDLLQSIEHIRSVTTDSDAVDMLNRVLQIEKEYGNVFDQITYRIRYINEALRVFIESMAQVSDSSEEISAMITQNESFLILDGKTVSINEVSLRDQLKSLQIILKSKLNDIQSLFLFSDIQTYENRRDRFRETLEKEKKNIQYLIGALNLPEYTRKWHLILEMIKKTEESEAIVADEWKAKTELAAELEKLSTAIQKIALEQAALTRQQIEAQSKVSDMITAAIGAVGGLTFLILGILIARSTRRALLTVVQGLNDGAEQIAAASSEMAGDSQALARLAGDQAASVEETTSALEEMMGMCKDTSKLTRDTEHLMNQNIEKSGQSLKNLVMLSNNMSQIESDNSRVGQIIKTIDEIAFQTNLLALNAAVEAARAGEAGAGFAVVADEVRNLAIRAASAAKDTQHLLQATVERVIQAANSLKFVSNDFEAIIESATVMGEKTNSITLASQKQENGISQVRLAMIEIDKGSQQTAASSEESAATAEELAAQVEQLKHYISVLLKLI